MARSALSELDDVFLLPGLFLAGSLEGHGYRLKRHTLLAGEADVILGVEHELVRPVRLEPDWHCPELALGVIMGAFGGLGPMGAAAHQ